MPRSSSASNMPWAIRERSTSTNCSRRPIARNPSRHVLYDEDAAVTTPDRDTSVDRLLSRRGWSGDIPDRSPQCLDANTLAAWVDGSLRASEVAAAEAHAAECARCQTTLAALVRVLPAT